MGFDTTLFVSKIESDYLCGICQKVADNPKTCEECEKLFCYECVLGLQRDSLKCPNCSNSKQELTKVHKIILTGLQKLQLKCKDCNEILQLQKYSEHQRNECIKSKWTCPNENQGCQIILPQQEMIQHMKNCSYNKVECELCSGQIFKFKQKDHNCQSFLFNMLDRHEQDLQEILYDQDDTSKILSNLFLNQQQNAKSIIKIADQAKKLEKTQRELLEQIMSFQVLQSLSSGQSGGNFQQQFI